MLYLYVILLRLVCLNYLFLYRRSPKWKTLSSKTLHIHQSWCFQISWEHVFDVSISKDNMLKGFNCWDFMVSNYCCTMDASLSWFPPCVNYYVKCFLCYTVDASFTFTNNYRYRFYKLVTLCLIYTEFGYVSYLISWRNSAGISKVYVNNTYTCF